MSSKVTLLLFTGGGGRSGIEQAVDKARRAAALDLLHVLLDTGSIGHAIVATDDPDWLHASDDLPIEVNVDPPGEPFHLGRRLAGLIEKHDAQRVLYSSGAAAPLLSLARWKEILAQLEREKQLLVTNNVNSCDWVGFTPATDVAPLIARQANDNSIAWALANETDLPVVCPPPSTATRFDLDTPIDLLVAQRHPDTGPQLRGFLEKLDWRAPWLDGVLAEMARTAGTLIVAGRVSEAAWALLTKRTLCWVRVFAEERGMRASGRQARGEVRSLLADYAELVGVDAFFDELAQLANGVILDSRVIVAARGIWPSRPDRFNADLYRWNEVEEPFLRHLARAASEAQVPVVMGGHSIVAGGLMALVESIPDNREGT